MTLPVDGELVDCEPVVPLRLLEVEHPHLRAGDGATRLAVLDRDPIDDHPVEGAVPRFERRPLRSPEAAERIVERLRRQGRVELRQRLSQAAVEDDLGVALSLGRGPVRRDVGAGLDDVAEALEPREGGLFDDRFGDAAFAHRPSSSRLRTRRIIRSFCAGSLSAISSASATIALSASRGSPSARSSSPLRRR